MPAPRVPSMKLFIRKEECVMKNPGQISIVVFLLIVINSYFLDKVVNNTFIVDLITISCAILWTIFVISRIRKGNKR